MDSSQLTAEQLEALNKRIAGMVAYLHALQERMERRGFPPNDELYRLTREAHDRVHHLRVTLHYAWCDKTKRS